MVYAINDRSSFDALKVLHEKLINLRQGCTAPHILVGNKCDMEADRKVKRDEGLKLVKDWGADFQETSAKNDINVTKVFE